MTNPNTLSAEEARARFRRTLLRVMTVQVISLALLWLLQRHYLV